jgi:hypothetical protein
VKTWAELRTEIKNEMNLNGEDFVTDVELLAFANDGIEQAEKEIVSLYDKYFETDTFLPIVNGQALYDLPSDILASKITHIEYDNGSQQYEIEYLKTKGQVRYLDQNDARYRYRMRNDSVNGHQIELMPKARETAASAVKIYYIRTARRIEVDMDVIEIPIADAFIKQYIKDQVRAKELGPMFNYEETGALSRQRALMIEALNHMIPDETRNEIEPDMRYYDDITDEFDYL